ncbi:MAG: type II toxin-antitoxin system RelE/ParE family toxin [Bacteroidetes bacterium]|nr:type II toxin-antitoxin system RelE/ParE family toxin [Bacteroidota bacterium]
MYKILFTQRAVKDFSKLNPETKTFLKEKIKDYSQNPFQHSKKMKDSRIGKYRFRMGDYRVVFDIDEDKIVVLRLGHRKEIYR